MTTHSTPSVADMFAPVANDLPKVDSTLAGVRDVEFQLLSDLVGHVLAKSCKKLRPALTLLAGKFYNYEANLHRLVPMASAMELLHTATLVHDDMVDDAMTRRGQTTLNSMMNGGTAVLVGDYLFAKSADLVASTENARVMTLFARTLMTICNGELKQLFTSFNWRQTREDYYNRINGKTASVFATSAESGAVLSEAPAEAIQALHDFGYNLGMAFQIVDDILDYTSTTEDLGKPTASDLRQGTVTLPALLLMERASGENPIQRLFESGHRTEDIDHTVDLIRRTGVIDEAFAVAREFCDRASATLGVLPDGEAKDALRAILDYVVARTY